MWYESEEGISLSAQLYCTAAAAPRHWWISHLASVTVARGRHYDAQCVPLIRSAPFCLFCAWHRCRLRSALNRCTLLICTVYCLCLMCRRYTDTLLWLLNLHIYDTPDYRYTGCMWKLPTTRSWVYGTNVTESREAQAMKCAKTDERMNVTCLNSACYSLRG